MNAGQWHKEIYFVDKTSIVETFLSLGHKVHLISVPQGFLKTSNLRLMASFFDITADPKVETNRRRVFQNTKIMSRAFIVAEYFGKYPTIFITFDHEESYDILKMIEVFRQLYKHNDYLLSSSQVTPNEKRKFNAYLNYQPPTLGSNQQTQLADSVSFLCELLHKHHGKKVYVFIDNYDSPILSTISHNRPMYNFLPFLERMLSNIAACKSLNRLVLSGTTSISQLGTMKIEEFKFLAQHKYAKYFGFTERDLQELAIRCSAEDKKSVSEHPPAGTLHPEENGESAVCGADEHPGDECDSKSKTNVENEKAASPSSTVTWSDLKSKDGNAETSPSPMTIEPIEIENANTNQTNGADYSSLTESASNTFRDANPKNASPSPKSLPDLEKLKAEKLEEHPLAKDKGLICVILDDDETIEIKRRKDANRSKSEHRPRTRSASRKKDKGTQKRQRRSRSSFEILSDDAADNNNNNDDDDDDDDDYSSRLTVQDDSGFEPSPRNSGQAKFEGNDANL
jgi:hypothetical protein